jgi:hypothetical protein
VPALLIRYANLKATSRHLFFTFSPQYPADGYYIGEFPPMEPLNIGPQDIARVLPHLFRPCKRDFGKTPLPFTSSF